MAKGGSRETKVRDTGEQGRGKRESKVREA